jgi:hypothetical protein
MAMTTAAARPPLPPLTVETEAMDEPAVAIVTASTPAPPTAAAEMVVALAQTTTATATASKNLFKVSR